METSLSLNIELIKTYDLEMQVYPNKESDVLDPEIEHTIIRFQQFDQLVECEVCGSSRKAQNRVVIRDEATGKEFASGLDCLYKHFNVSQSDLERAVYAPKRLARAWQLYIAPWLPENKRRFKSTKDAFKNLGDFIAQAVSFPCPAAEQVSDKVNSMPGRMADVTSGNYDGDIDSIILFLTLQYEHLNKNSEYRRRALLDHPLWRKKKFNRSRIPFRQFFENPGNLDWKQLCEMKDTLVQARKEKINPMVIGVPPYRYASEEEYVESLRNYMEEKADSSNLPSDPGMVLIEGSRETSQIAESLLQDVKRRGGLKFKALRMKNRRDLEELSISPFCKGEVRKHGGYDYFSEIIHVHKESTTPVDTGSVQSMLRRGQEVDDKPKRQGAISRGKDYYYRIYGVFVPELWHDAYAVWHHYGGVETGRKATEGIDTILSY